jgi:hypothetical protein
MSWAICGSKGGSSDEFYTRGLNLGSLHKPAPKPRRPLEEGFTPTLLYVVAVPDLPDRDPLSSADSSPSVLVPWLRDSLRCKGGRGWKRTGGFDTAVQEGADAKREFFRSLYVRLTLRLRSFRLQQPPGVPSAMSLRGCRSSLTLPRSR